MDRDQLAAAHTAAIRKHWRNLTDTDGKPASALLDDLAVIANHHHITEVTKLADTPPAKPPAGPAPRRTTTRKPAK